MMTGKKRRRWLAGYARENLAFILVFLFRIPHLMGQAEKPLSKHDTSYYESFRNELTARVYLSNKYNVIVMNPPGDDQVPQMSYRPNTKLAVGLGATYRSFTLNIAVGIAPLHEVEDRGKTKYFDLQWQFYARKWNFDFLGQFYRGYYLTPQGLGAADNKSYYVRNDLGVQMGGIAAYRALNDRRVSYQAGLVQSEWQKRSAGSFVIGGETFYGAMNGDSVLVPSSVDPAYAAKGIRQVHFFQIGPGIGYGYTLVYRKHLFALASVTANFDFRFAREIENDHNADRTDFTPNFRFHAGLGYNTRKWNLSVLWAGNRIYVKGGGSGYQYQISAGNFRLIYAHRFPINREIKKVLEPINQIIEQN